MDPDSIPEIVAAGRAGLGIDREVDVAWLIHEVVNEWQGQGSKG